MSKELLNDNRLYKVLSSYDEMFPVIKKHELGPFVHWNENNKTPMHRWFRYREAYSPELIDKLDLGPTILDPFCGCGSILVGAASRKLHSTGVDLNPVACFSAKVKLTKLSESQIHLLSYFLQRTEDICNAAHPWPIPQLSVSQKIFEPQILNTLLIMRNAIENFSNNDQGVRDFLLLAWISILEPVGSYFKEGNGIKYRNKIRKKGRYEDRPDGLWQLERFGTDQEAFVYLTFKNKLRMMIDDTIEWKNGNWENQRIINGSAFNLEAMLSNQKFQSIVFSPPYANRFDYFESFKVELWFGGFINSYEEMNVLRKESMRSHFGADIKKSYMKFEPLEELIYLMDNSASSWKMGISDLLRGYFHDLFAVLKQCKAVMPTGCCYVVIGNSAFAGVIVPSDILTAYIAQRAGFEYASLIETRHLSVSPQQRSKLIGYESFMRESVVLLK